MRPKVVVPEARAWVDTDLDLRRGVIQAASSQEPAGRRGVSDVTSDRSSTQPALQPEGTKTMIQPFSPAVRGRSLGSRTSLVIALVALVAAVLVPLAAAPASAACGSVIACENSLPGTTPSTWQVSGSGDATIQGFATSISVNVGGAVQFKVKTTATSYHIDILRMGYYQGNGARTVAAGVKPSAALPQSQPACRNDTQATGLIDCGNWAISASWAVPSTAVSGVYLARLVRDDTKGASLVPFIVRNDAGHSDMIFQTSDETWQAYNSYGGNSLYTCSVNCPPGSPDAYKGASKVSYNRPFHSADDDQGRSWLMYAEYPMIRFLEQNGYDVSYTSGIDVGTSAGGALLTNHQVFLSVGHDEYWSASQRANVEAARDQGVDLAFFSGNEVFWKTRFEPSIDGASTANRTLVCYKDTHYNSSQDPVAWTGTWQDPRFSPPGDGGRPQPSTPDSGSGGTRPWRPWERGRPAPSGQGWGCSVTSGTRSRTTASGRPGSSICRRPPRRRRRSSPTTAAL
jgi:hypothetical protein